jgi:3-methyladenine DNA glycosylase AlkD
VPGNDFDAGAAAEAVIALMRPLGTAERASREKRYLKSDLEFLGVSVPDIRRSAVTVARSCPGLGAAEAVAWALALWQEPVHERRVAAVEVLARHAGVLAAADLGTAEALIRQARGWALVDPLAVHVAGAIAARDPASWRRVDAWAGDGDFWVRRAALLALLPGIRAGHPDLDRFERYAAAMLADPEFFIRKAIGWVLREICGADPGWAAAWTGRHLPQMSGVTFREAVRRLPPADADRLRGSRAALAPAARSRDDRGVS